MRFASPGSYHERRLELEGAFLYRLFAQLAPRLGVFLLGRDGLVLGLIGRLDLDLPGVSATKIRIGSTEATALIGPGVVFGRPELADDLRRLRRDAEARGRRILIVPKRSLKRRARQHLPAAALIERRRDRARSRRCASEGDAASLARQNARVRVPVRSGSTLGFYEAEQDS